MPKFHFARSVSLAISLLGAFVNFAFAVQLLSAYRSLKWQTETEWEGAERPWRRDGVQLLWGLLSAYFAAAASVCVVGFIGITKNIPVYVRFYRDYSIADFAFTSFFTTLAAYAAFTAPTLRAILCEELARQPDFMREMEAGVGLALSLENCEGWVERAVLAGAAGMVVVIVGRLHCLIALCAYHRHMRAALNASSSSSLPMHMHPTQPQQQIYVLPQQTPTTDEMVVYQAVPLSALSPQQSAALTRAWISRAPADQAPHHGRRHSNAHRRHGSRDGSLTGKICLPVAPQEGLLPAYDSVKA
ncbi:hypothetical protein FIBSPDRAFT_914644 [Athelia psychrophila]|uniref:Uncharacterized protein n=1 Tax=Athelia psychrophila TaxID=1759441 RepID=A0A167X263_9AGAM|nr:hypothetical protein FIBSPDRAFT_914644 [Fibularhizoctonia sp. CBS 109695]